jgi:DNA-binding transcriptional regulator YhcF (GntR family)
MRSATHIEKLALPAAALLSFLKETRGATTWTVRDLTKTLKLTPVAAKEAIAILQMQGYVNSAGSKGEWITTQAGEIVSGSKTPRYSHATVEESLAAFADHLKRVNEDSSARYKIAQAVAFGDFLSNRVRVQAADIGIRLTPRSLAAEIPREPAQQPPAERERQATFLKQLRGRTPLLNILPYAEWMSVRTHRNLLIHSR